MARTRFGIQRGGARIRAALDGRAEPVTARTHARRQRCVAAGFSALAALYAGRLVYLQVLHGEELHVRAIAQSVEEEELPASRGDILDRDGLPLAADDTRYHAYLAPRELSVTRDRAIEAIDAVLDLSPERRRRLREARGGWESIGRGVTDEERRALLTSVANGIHFEPYPSRVYPRGGIARGLIGSIGSDGAGAGGLELHLDSLLRGRPGAARVRVDGRRRAYRLPDALVAAPQPGYDVVLTLDADLQRIAENELARALARTGASAGDIVLFDPRTGELLAVASEREGAAQGHVPAFSDPYEPGSTAKPFLLATLLDEGLVDLDEVIDVEGGALRIGRRLISDVHGFDTLTVREVISQSSNVGAAKLAGRLRPAVQHSYLRDFGFGMPTQIDHPAESGGRLRRHTEWTPLSPASHAMGYELSVTSLQLVAAYGALANDGVLMRPILVREIRDREGQVVWTASPQRIRRVVRSEIARAVSLVLRDVVQEGTGSLARMATFTVAGKTGTARLASGGRYVAGRYRASFVGFAPADAPRLVILVRLEDPARGAYYGGAIAAPTAQATLEAALATRGGRVDRRLVASTVEPRRWADGTVGARTTGPFVFAVGGGEAEPAPRRQEREAVVVVPDLTGLPSRSAIARLHRLGLRVEWGGRGRVTQQRPAPGYEAKRGGTVVLR